MLVGYNTNISYKGTVYHVQTEDSGLNNPVIVTLLYVKGTILASKKTNYAHLVGDPDYREKARELMKDQHKKMLKELIAGKHTGGSAEQHSPSQETAAEEMRAAEPPQETQAAAQQTSADAVTADVKPSPAAAAHAPEAAAADETAGTEGPAASPLSSEQGKKRQISKSLDDILLDYIMKREE